MSNETSGDESIIIKDEPTTITMENNDGSSSMIGNKPTLIRQSTTTGNDIHNNDNKSRSNSPDISNGSCNGQIKVNNNDSNSQYGTPIITDCSLLKIKEKLEYHLICLKSILNMMSDGAELITHTYLEDIQSGEDRFDQSLLGGNNNQNGSNISGGGGLSSIIDGQLDSMITPRHYYTSN